MKQIKSALLLYPNQLFAPELLPKADVIYLIEEPLFFGRDNNRSLNMHKQKLVLHRASMRRYIEEVLWPNDLNVEYIELKDIEFTADVLVRAQQAGVEVVMVFDPTDDLLESRLKKALDDTVETPFELRVLPSPSFMLKRGEVRDYFTTKANPKFNDFYQWQRERFNILIDENYRPVGEKWQIEAKQQILDEGQVAPGFKAFGDNDFVKDAKKWVENNFINNPGQVDSFFWPTSNSEALAWLNDFISIRLEASAYFKDEIDSQAILLFHSGISALLNCGLLTPLQVVDTVLAAHHKSPIDLASLEGFIRSVIGYREFVRGLYVTGSNLAKPQPLPSQVRSLSSQWWDGTTGLLPLDDVIKKVLAHAFVTHPERLMIISNLMILCEISPEEAYRWQAAMLIDAYDWMIAPNVYGVAQLSNLNSMLSQPYITSAEYILGVSHYQKDIWCDIWDGLFWAFVEKHKDLLKGKSHLASTIEHLAKITPEHRRIISYRAQDFITSIS